MRKLNTLIGVIDGSMDVERAVEMNGAHAVVLDMQTVLDEVFGEIDGIVLCGGTDINPDLYGAQKHSAVWVIDNYRDRLELKAIELAKKSGIPILGICRGAQILNVSYGGTLHQHIDEFLEGNMPHFMGDHSITMRRESRIGRITKASIWEVNSLHHQAVDRVGEGLLASAWSHDGIVEVIESAPWVEQFILGVQFHPEMLTHDSLARRIFRHFIHQANEFGRNKPNVIARATSVDEKLARYDVKSGSYQTGWAGGYENHSGWSVSPPAKKKPPILQMRVENHICERCTPEHWYGGGMEGEVCDGDGQPPYKVVEYFDEEKADYEEWERLNDNACAFPPCRYPASCNPQFGDCLAEAVADEHDRTKGRIPIDRYED